MTGRLIPTSSEAEWLEARRRGITASEIPIVMGLSPYSSPYALYWQKLGLLPGVEETDAMALGKHMESYVAERFAERRPEFHVTGTGRQLYAHPDRPWQMATPDRLVYESPEDAYQYPGVPLVEPLAVLECKIDGGSDEWGEEGTDEIPVHYRCQVLYQMDVTGVTTAFVAALLWQRRQVRVYELTMDDAAQADLKLMREEARDFLDRIDLGDPPDIDWRPATTAALRHLHPAIEDHGVTVGRQLAISYRAACRRYKAAEQRKDEMTNRMLAAIGDGRRAVEANTGTPVATRSISAPKRVSASLVRERHPDVVADCTVVGTVTKLIPAKAKEPPA